MLVSSEPPRAIMTCRVVFTKDGAQTWLAHLDVMRLFERAFRRCDIPVALSQGFNPRPRLRFVLPSAVGVAARADVLFVDLERPVRTAAEVAAARTDLAEASQQPFMADLITRLNAVLPDGVRVLSAEVVPDSERKAALRSYRIARYRLIFECPADLATAAAERALDELAITDTATVATDPAAPREVRVRPYLTHIRLARPSSGQLEVQYVTRFGQEGTLRPQDVAELLVARLPTLALRRAERLSICELSEEEQGESGNGE